MARAPNDWQSGCTEVKQRGGYLLQTGQWSDCTFLVGTEPNHVVVPGHKLILAMASPVFEAMFFGNMPERNEPIRILDVQPEAFKALLEYIYTDNINISSFDKACELCYGAKKYMLPHLVKECTRYLWSDLYPKNACRAYEFARLFEENILMEKCLQIISTNTKDVLNDNSFEDVELNTVITVFSQNHLNIDSELDLFEAAERYAKVQDKRTLERSVSPPRDRRKSPEPSTSKDKVVNVESSSESSPEAVIESDPTIADCEKDDTCSHKLDDKLSSCGGSGKSDSCDDGSKGENHGDNSEAHCDQHKTEPQSDNEERSDSTRNTDKLEKEKPEGREIPSIRSAIQKIRFLTLTPQQFAKGPATSPLLTESESFAILMNILSSTSDVAMPKGFSTCRVPRKQLIGGYNTNRPTNSNTNAKPGFSVDVPSPELVEFVYNGLVDLWRAPPPNGHSSSHQAPQMGLAPSLPKQARHDASMYVPMSLGAGAGHSHEAGERGFELNKIYCQRPIIQHTDCLNTSVLDCSVTFMVDKNICLLGVQVPTQAPSEESGTCAPPPPAYSELLYAHLLDADGARLTYTHYTNRVPYRQLQDIIFNRPVYIQRNKVYKVGIVFNKMGWYPMGTCAQQVVAESVFFNFGIGQTSDSVRDGLIRAIIFTY